MAKTFRQNGDILTLTLAVAVVSGEGVLVGKIFGVAQGSYAADEAGEYATCGVHELAAKPADVGIVGAPLYWDAAAKWLTSTAGGNTRVGVVVPVAKIAGAATAWIKIDSFIA